MVMPSVPWSRPEPMPRPLEHSPFQSGKAGGTGDGRAATYRFKASKSIDNPFYSEAEHWCPELGRKIILCMDGIIENISLEH